MKDQFLRAEDVGNELKRELSLGIKRLVLRTEREVVDCVFKASSCFEFLCLCTLYQQHKNKARVV